MMKLINEKRDDEMIPHHKQSQNFRVESRVRCGKFMHCDVEWEASSHKIKNVVSLLCASLANSIGIIALLPQ